MSDEFMQWTADDKAAAFDAIAKALCTCSAAGPCSICDVIWYGGDLAKPVLDRFKDAERATQNAWKYADSLRRQ